MATCFVPPEAAAAFSIISVAFLIKKGKKKNRYPRRWWSKQLFLGRNQYRENLMREMAQEPIDDTIKNFVCMST
jgi:hypothetical protein